MRGNNALKGDEKSSTVVEHVLKDHPIVTKIWFVKTGGLW